MALVVNKSEIVIKLNQFYGSEDGLNVAHTPLKVAQLVAFTDDYSMYVGGGWLGQYIDDDYAIDLESACVFGNGLYEKFSISPTKVYIVPETEYGVTFEWIPYRPLYVSSMEEYIGLYKSFANYLESISDKVNFKICFYPLYMEQDSSDDFKDDNTKKLFSDYFKSTDMTIQTHGTILKSSSDKMFLPC